MLRNVENIDIIGGRKKGCENKLQTKGIKYGRKGVKQKNVKKDRGNKWK